jgi:hypothetical protein
MPTDPKTWPVADPANKNNTVPTYHVEHDHATKVEKRSGKAKRVKKVFNDPAEAAAFYERMKDEDRHPRGSVSFVHKF